MSKNTEKSKDFLARAIQNLPNDYALSEVRQFLKMAMARLEHVEKKRENRAMNQHERWQQDLEVGLQNPYNAKQTLDEIERMIAAEASKIKNIQERKKQAPLPDSDETTLFD